MRVWRDGLKWCGGPCGRNLPREAYYPHRSRGYLISQSWCKECSRVNVVTRWRRLYRTVTAFREKEKAKSRALYRKHAEKRKARARARYWELKHARLHQGVHTAPLPLPTAGPEFLAKIKAAIGPERRGRPRKNPVQTRGLEVHGGELASPAIERTRASSPGV